MLKISFETAVCHANAPLPTAEAFWYDSSACG